MPISLLSPPGVRARSLQVISENLGYRPANWVSLMSLGQARVADVLLALEVEFEILIDVDEAATCFGMSPLLDLIEAKVAARDLARPLPAATVVDLTGKALRSAPRTPLPMPVLTAPAYDFKPLKGGHLTMTWPGRARAPAARRALNYAEVAIGALIGLAIAILVQGHDPLAFLLP